jgi:hypothetical protein
MSKLFGPTDRHRTVYRPIMHEIVPADLSVFDFPEPELVTGKRSITTVPTQALYMMNSDLVVKHSQKTAQRLLAGSSDDRDRVQQAYRLMLGRDSTEDEITEAIAFISAYPPATSDDKNKELAAWSAFCQTLFASAEFRYLYSR